MRQLSLSIALLLFPALALAVGQSPQASLPADARITVRLELESLKQPDGRSNIVPTLTIKNEGKAGAKIQHPDNRMAVEFLISDESGNVLAPELAGKADPASFVVSLAPGNEFSHAFTGLEFTSGTGLFRYTLKRGETYRVVAVYRPAGREGPGICSDEVVITTK